MRSGDVFTLSVHRGGGSWRDPPPYSQDPRRDLLHMAGLHKMTPSIKRHQPLYSGIPYNGAPYRGGLFLRIVGLHTGTPLYSGAPHRNSLHIVGLHTGTLLPMQWELYGSYQISMSYAAGRTHLAVTQEDCLVWMSYAILCGTTKRKCLLFLRAKIVN